MLTQGFIRLHRQTLEKPIWLNSTSEQKVIMITCLMLANWTPQKWEWKGKPYECKPGEFISSYASIAKAAGKGISTQNVRTALKRFQNLEFLTVLSTGGYKDGIKVIITNWALYQNETNRLTNSFLTGSSQTPNSFLTTNEEYKNNNILDFQNSKKFIKPTIEEIETYCLERKNSIDAQTFFDFYESNGWKVGKNPMKDWRAAVRTWEKNSKQQTNREEQKEYVYNPYL